VTSGALIFAIQKSIASAIFALRKKVEDIRKDIIAFAKTQSSRARSTNDHANGESMALIKCSECGTEISDSAAACVKCGAPIEVARRQARDSNLTTVLPSASGNKKKGAGLALALCVALVGFVVILIELSSHDNSNVAAPSVAASASMPDASTSVQPGPTVAAASAAEARAASEAASASEAEAEEAARHNYTTEQEGEYGYQSAISDDDRRQGIAAKPLMMVRYRGVIDGRTTIDQQASDGGVMRVDCKEPCDFLRLRLMVGGQTIHTETLPNDPQTLGGEMMDDARNGKLKVYGAK